METMDKENTRWVLDFYGPQDNLLAACSLLKDWADKNNLEFRYTDLADNEYGMPVIAILPKEEK